MKQIETIEAFYKEKLKWMPECIKKGMGHFNIFPLNSCTCTLKRPTTFSRRDFYKITLLKGHYMIHYSDRDIEVTDYALVFSAPMVPYNWETLDSRQDGYFCIFTENFFTEYGTLKEYPMFKPGNNMVYLFDENKLSEIESIFQKMTSEMTSDFIYKYDVLRGLVFNLIHTALKIKPVELSSIPASNASIRLTSMFTELLEHQFPVESPAQRLKLRAPVDFSEQLAVHVNHLNHCLKDTTGKTTSQLITERVAQEAGLLLKHTNWNISEIAYCLGFEELPHFINFFKKNFQITPKTYRDTATI
jgi:AraC family transcriptional regulator, transcriptional activator of pobA